MNSSTGSLQDSVNLFFTFLVYVPVNLAVMLAVSGLMALLNRVLRLRFPFVIVTIAAGLLVFAMMFAWLDDVNQKRGWVSFREAPSGQYGFTLALAGLQVILAFIISGVIGLVRRGKPAAAPSSSAPAPTRMRLIAIAVWLFTTLGFASIPFIRQGGEAFAEARHEAHLREFETIITRNDIAAFREEAARDGSLWNVKLPGTQDPLFDELIRRDRADLVGVLLSQDQKLFDHAFDWDVKSTAMVDRLVASGMDRDRLTMELVDGGDEKLVRHMLERYPPLFFAWADLTTSIVLKRKDWAMLDLLIKHGLIGNAETAKAATLNCARHNQFEELKLLVDKGFPMDLKSVALPHWAIYHENLPMLQWLLPQEFDVNTRYDEYTLVETAIIGNKLEIFDYLLTLNPDVTTLHETKLNGPTNALKLAERYNRPDMAKALKQ